MSKRVTLRLPDKIADRVAELAREMGKTPTEVMITALEAGLWPTIWATPDLTDQLAAISPLPTHIIVDPAPADESQVEILLGAPADSMSPKVGVPKACTPLASLSQTERFSDHKSNFPEPGVPVDPEIVLPGSYGYMGIDRSQTAFLPSQYRQISEEEMKRLTKGLERSASEIKMSAEEGTQTDDVPVHGEGQKGEGRSAVAKVLNKCPDCGERLIPWGEHKRCRSCERNW